MNSTNSSSAFTAADMRIALSDVYPEATYGAVPVLDQYDALETYRAFDDGGLEAVPQAFATYADFQQRQWM